MEEEQHKHTKRPNEHLRRERELRGWSQQFLAEKVGTTESLVSLWEIGRHKPNRHFQTQLCQLFAKNAEELGFIETSPTIEGEKDVPSVNRLREIIHHLGKSVERVAADIDVSTRIMYHYVNGKVVVPDDLRAPLAKVLGCEQEFLFPHPSTWLPKVTKEDPSPSQEKGTSIHPHERTRRDKVEEIPLLDQDEMNQQRRQLLTHTLKGAGSTFLASHDELLRGAFSDWLISTLTRSLDLAELRPLLHIEEILSLYATSIPIYWRLYFDGYIPEIKRVLPECLSHLSLLASQTSSSQKQAASLASQASQLACMLALQEQTFGDAALYARQGFQYGQIAEDPNLQAASLIRKALVYFYLKKPEQKLLSYQHALQYKAAITPLLKSRIYMGLVEAYGNFGQEYEAKQFLEQCHNTLPARPQDDPSFAYTHFSGYSRIYESLLYLDLHQPQKALDTLGSLKKTTATSGDVEFIVRQTSIFIALGNLRESCTALETAAIAARSLGSKLRFEEVRDLYQQMCAVWPHEQSVQELSDLFLA